MPLRDAGTRLKIEGLGQYVNGMRRATQSNTNFAGSGTAINRGLSGVSAGFAGVQRGASALTRGIGTVTRAAIIPATIATAALGTAAAATGISSIKTAAQYEASFSGIASILQKPTSELGALDKLVTDLAVDPSLKVGFEDAFAATAALLTVGTDYEDVLGGTLRSTILLQNATGSTFDTAATAVAKYSAAFGLLPEQTEDLTNALVGVRNNSSLGVDDLLLLNAQGGSVAKLGVELNDFLVTASLVDSSFASGSDLGTAFKTFTTRLSAPTETASDALKELGISFFDAAGNLKDLPDVIAEINRGFGDLSELDQNLFANTIFGADAARFALSLIGITQEDFAERQEAIFATDAADIAAIATDNLSSAWDTLGDSVQAANKEFGQNFLGDSTGIVRSLSDAVGAATPIIGELGAAAAARVGPGVQNASDILTATADNLGEGVSLNEAFQGAIEDLGGIKIDLGKVFTFVGEPNFREFTLGGLVKVTGTEEGVTVNLGESVKYTGTAEKRTIELGGLVTFTGTANTSTIQLGNLVKFSGNAERQTINLGESVRFINEPGFRFVELGGLVKYTGTPEKKNVSLFGLIEYTGTPNGETIDLADGLVTYTGTPEKKNVSLFGLIEYTGTPNGETVNLADGLVTYTGTPEKKNVSLFGLIEYTGSPNGETIDLADGLVTYTGTPEKKNVSLFGLIEYTGTPNGETINLADGLVTYTGTPEKKNVSLFGLIEYTGSPNGNVIDLGSLVTYTGTPESKKINISGLVSFLGLPAVKDIDVSKLVNFTGFDKLNADANDAGANLSKAITDALGITEILAEADALLEGGPDDFGRSLAGLAPDEIGRALADLTPSSFRPEQPLEDIVSFPQPRPSRAIEQLRALQATPAEDFARPGIAGLERRPLSSLGQVPTSRELAAQEQPITPVLDTDIESLLPPAALAVFAEVEKFETEFDGEMAITPTVGDFKTEYDGSLDLAVEVLPFERIFDGELILQTRTVGAPSANDSAPTPPNIPQNATGAMSFAGGVTSVSEQGDELIVTPDGARFVALGRQLLDLPKGTQIYNARETQRLLGIAAANTRATLAFGEGLIGATAQEEQQSEREKRISVTLEPISIPNTSNNQLSTISKVAAGTSPSGVKLSSINFFADGGAYSGGLAIAGERGPELFVPRVGQPRMLGADGPEAFRGPSGQIYDARATMAILKNPVDALLKSPPSVSNVYYNNTSTTNRTENRQRSYQDRRTININAARVDNNSIRGRTGDRFLNGRM